MSAPNLEFLLKRLNIEKTIGFKFNFAILIFKLFWDYMPTKILGTFDSGKGQVLNFCGFDNVSVHVMHRLHKDSMPSWA